MAGRFASRFAAFAARNGRTWGSRVVVTTVLPSAVAAFAVTADEEQFAGSSSSSLHGRVAFADVFAATAVGTPHIVDDLVQVLGKDAVSVDADDRAAHGSDRFSHHHGGRALVVVYPQSTEQVAAIVKLAAQHRVPIIPYGSGTSLEGHTVVTTPAISIDMSHMCHVLAVRPDDLDCTVQAGVVWGQLNEHLKPTGLFFPMDPGPGASIGGMVGTGCSGTNAVRYGTMRQNVLSLTVVLPDGSILKTGQRARKSVAGYDLTSLFVGSEGTLGIITEATLKLAHIPEQIVVASAAFPTVADAAHATHEIMRRGVQIGCVELLDDVMMKAINLNGNHHYKEAPTLFFKLVGSKGAVQEAEHIVKQVVQRFGGTDFASTMDPVKRDKMWEARKTALWAAPALQPGSTTWTTDVCVPLSAMPECIEATKRDLVASRLIAPIVGHVGDGNFHVILLLDPHRPEDLAEAQALNKRMIQRAIEMQGTCTGEHGVGVGKREFLESELGATNVATMRVIKAALDPLGIMNPGKLIPDGHHDHHGHGHGHGHGHA